MKTDGSDNVAEFRSAPVDAALAGLHIAPNTRLMPRAHRLRHQHRQRSPDQFRRRVAEDFLRRRVDEHDLTPPLHVRMAGFLLALLLPRPPVGGLLLGDADEHHPTFATLLSGSAQQWLSDLLLVFFLGEVANGNIVGFGPAVDLGHIGFADLAEGRRRGNRKATLPMEKPAHLADGLQLGDVRLQEDAIDRTTGQRDVVTQQGGIIGHGVALVVWNPRRLHR